jgi:hypothetical protein
VELGGRRWGAQRRSNCRTATTTRPHDGGGTGQERGQAARTGRCRTSLCSKGMGEGTGQGWGRWSEVTVAKSYAVRTKR